MSVCVNEVRDNKKTKQKVKKNADKSVQRTK